MRPPEVEDRFILDPSVPRLRYDHLRLEIRSGHWRGEDVAHCVKRWAAGRERFIPLGNTDDFTVEMQFGFREEQLVTGPEGIVRHPAHVAVLLALPAPSPQCIAATFDADVRMRRQWHLRLPSSAPRVDPLVRIRTWAIGLLMGAAWSFDDAWRAVAALLGVHEDGLSQEADRQARRLLIRDVPEATARLTARRRVR